MLHRDSPIPLYYQLKEIIHHHIVSGEWTAGKRIPSEKELGQEYDVSRTTVRQALEELVHEGLLSRAQGVGTFVSYEKMEHELGRLTSFTEDIRIRGLEPSSRLVSIEIISPPEGITKKLDMQAGEQVLKIVRVRLADGEPVGIHTNYIKNKFDKSLKELKNIFSEESTSFYEFSEANGVPPIDALESIEAVPANEVESKYLNVAEFFPLLLITRTTYSLGKSPLEYCRMVYRADRYRYNIYLSRYGNRSRK